MLNRYPNFLVTLPVDINTSPERLVELSKEFPFVEWAIPMNADKVTLDYRKRVYDLILEKDARLNLQARFNTTASMQAYYSGGHLIWSEVDMFFQRMGFASSFLSEIATPMDAMSKFGDKAIPTVLMPATLGRYQNVCDLLRGSFREKYQPKIHALPVYDNRPRTVEALLTSKAAAALANEKNYKVAQDGVVFNMFGFHIAGPAELDLRLEDLKANSYFNEGVFLSVEHLTGNFPPVGGSMSDRLMAGYKTILPKIASYL